MRTCDAYFKLLFPHTFIIPAYLWPWRGLSLVFWGCRGDLEFTLLSLRSVCSWSGSEYEIFNTFEIQASLISWHSACWGWDCTCNVWASAQCLNVYACDWLFVPLAQLVTSAQACVVNTVWNKMYARTHRFKRCPNAMTFCHMWLASIIHEVKSEYQNGAHDRMLLSGNLRLW